MLLWYTSMFGWPLAIIFALGLAFGIGIINFTIGFIKDIFYKRQSNVDMNINQNSQFVNIEVTQATSIPTIDYVQRYPNRGGSGWRRSSIPNNLEITNISQPPQSSGRHQRSHSAIALPSDLPPSYFESVTSKFSETPPPQYYHIFCESSV